MKYKKLFEPKVEELEFDPFNPRLPKKLQNKSDKEVVEWMLLDASLLDLVASIGMSGFFPGEPLLVVENKETRKFTVIEGNRRLASCKILKNPMIANVKQKTVLGILSESPKENIPQTVPAFLFDRREDILEYLGYRHVTGVKSWGSLPKAKYLHELFNNDKSNDSLSVKCKRLAKKIGSRGDYVLRLLTSYELFLEFEKNNFYGIQNLSEENIDFSNLVDSATRFSNISTHLNIDFDSETPLKNLNTENFIELTKWLYERDDEGKSKIVENRNIKVLNSIIVSPRALESFKEGAAITEAYLLTESPDKIFEKSLENSIKNLNNAKDVIESIKEQTKSIGLKHIKVIDELIKKLVKSIS